MKKDKIYLSINISHNSSASIMRNGEILFAACEERYRRIKNIMSYPKFAIEACFKYTGIKPNQIDKAAFTSSDNQPLLVKSQYVNKLSNKELWEHYSSSFYSKNKKKKLSYLKWLHNNKRFQDKLDLVDYKFLKIDKNYFKKIKYFEKEYTKAQKDTLFKHTKIPKEKIVFIDHHTCHAYYAYFGSPFRNKKTNVVTLDSMGDGRNMTIWTADKNKLKIISDSSENDIGRVYTFATLILGMRPDEHEFKVMGMAPYAKKKYINEAYKPLKDLSIIKNLKIKRNKRPKDLFNYLYNSWNYHRFDNISGAVQLFAEKLTKKLFNQIYLKTKISRFVLSGGIALNIKMNQELSKLKFVKEFFVCGSGGDESLAIGGNYYLNRESKNKQNKPIFNMCLGDNISKDIKNFNIKKNKYYDTKIVTNPNRIAKIISEDKILAVANSRSEFGVRALGNRSILANPSNIDNVKQINKAIKSRDFWMPFALSILEESHKKFIHNPKNISCPSMSITFDTIKENRSKICCGIHPYDFTVRPQFVNKIHNHDYYKLINEFKKITGIPALLNTSFNLHGEPIVETTSDAIRTFLNSDLDHLWLYNTYLLSKK